MYATFDRFALKMMREQEATGSLNGANMTAQEFATKIASNPATSYWLRGAIAALLERDVLDARNDAEILAEIFRALALEALVG